MPRFKRGVIRQALLKDERTWVWLSNRTGYTPGHLRDVDAGRQKAATKFWVAVQSVLGDLDGKKVA